MDFIMDELQPSMLMLVCEYVHMYMWKRVCSTGERKSARERRMICVGSGVVGQCDNERVGLFLQEKHLHKQEGRK